MIDMHSHILPGVDDGARDMEESMRMLSVAARSGTRIIAATSHIREGRFENTAESLQKVFEKVTEEKRHRGINIDILFGAEIHVVRDVVKQIQDNQFPTYGNQGKYILLEFPPEKIPEWADEIIFELKINAITPIIAHPERSVLDEKKLDRIYDIVYKGALIQLDSSSITGGFGQSTRKISRRMIELNLAHFIGSDAHSTDQRTPDMSNAYEFIRIQYGFEKAEELFYKNSKSVLEGTEVFTHTPQRPSRDEGSFFNMIRTKVSL